MEKVMTKVKVLENLKTSNRLNEINYITTIKNKLRIYNKEQNKYGFIFNKLYFIIIVLYLCLFKTSYSLEKIFRIIYSQYSYVIFKINSTGNIPIFHVNDNRLDNVFCVPHPPQPDEVYINGVNQSQITTSYYFNHSDNNITYIWKNNLTTTCCMFKSCSKITEMDFSLFDTSQVTTMYSMFDSCSSLTSLNLSNFNTLKVTDMDFMFSGCESLKSLDLSYFETSQVIRMGFMFSYCQSLITLNLSNFNSSKVYNFDEMFGECSS